MEEVMEARTNSKQEDKKHRKRMKKIYTQIREQMEFYFSDANLYRDRFLNKVIEESEDGFVDLEIFQNFNKMRAITTDTDLTAKALCKTSKLLEVSKDGKCIRRRTPLKAPENVDEKTIYVERLPPAADHESVKKVFSAFGNVMYVSLPRYKTTGDIKGFAFVEFDSIEAADKACNMGDSPPCNQKRPGWFPKGSKQMKQLQKQVEKQEAFLNNSKEEGIEVMSKKVAAKRKSTGILEESTPSKQVKTEGESDTNKDVVKDEEGGHDEMKSNETKNVGDGQKYKEIKDKQESNTMSEKQSKKSKKRRASTKDIEVRDIANDSVSKRQKIEQTSGKMEKTENKNNSESIKSGKKKRHRTGEGASDTQDQAHEVNDGKTVMKEERKVQAVESSKKRVKILEQRSETGNKDADVTCIERKKKKRKKRKNKEKTKDVFSITQLRVISKKQWMEIKKEYLNLQKANMTALKRSLNEIRKQNQNVERQNTETAEKKPKQRLIDFVPGVVVKVVSAEPLTKSSLKETLPSPSDIAYVDLKDGEREGFIRFKASEGTSKNLTSSVKFTLNLLEGDEEKAYWDKLQADREARLSSKTRTKKRGSQKIVEKAEKLMKTGILAEKQHIRFDD